MTQSGRRYKALPLFFPTNPPRQSSPWPDLGFYRGIKGRTYKNWPDCNEK